MNKFHTDKQNIINWLDKYQVKNYTLVLDKKYGFIVNVISNVDFYYGENPELKKIQKINDFKLIYL